MKVNRIHIASIICLMLMICLVIFTNMSILLVVQDELPNKIDVIFTFSGEVKRIDYSCQILKRYNKAIWLVSIDSTKYCDLNRRKIKVTNTTFIVDTCSSTWSEMSYFKNWLQKMVKPEDADAGNVDKNIQDNFYVGFVSSPFHMRRIKLCADKMINDKHITCIYMPYPFPMYSITKDKYRKWWMDPWLERVIILEYLKMLYYIFR